MKFKNKQEINSITICPHATCYCPLGNDWYENEFTIRMVPDEWIPDYCDVDKFITENICGKNLIIEDAVTILYDYLETEYRPDGLVVTSSVDNAGHSPVVVSRGVI